MAKKENKPNVATPDHWHDVLSHEFAGESDRACVILAATLLDTALATLLKTYFAPSVVARDSLFDGANAPLASFSARIDLAYRLGLVSALMARDLHLIRRIRNDFAHNITGCSFDDPSARDRILELSRSSRVNEQHEIWRELYPDTPRGYFQVVVGWIQWHLRSLTSDTQAITPAVTEWGYTKDWESLGKDDG